MLILRDEPNSRAATRDEALPLAIFAETVDRSPFVSRLSLDSGERPPWAQAALPGPCYYPVRPPEARPRAVWGVSFGCLLSWLFGAAEAAAH